MNPISEADLDLLDTYLDDALEPHEAEALRRRLPAEPALATALEEMRRERQIRQSMYSDMEGDEQAVETIVSGVTAAISRREAFAARMRMIRRVGSLAACLAIVFLAGWYLRMFTTPFTKPAGPTAVTNTATTVYQVRLTDAKGNVLAIQRFDSMDHAQKFTEDLTHWQSQQQDLAEGQPVVVSDRF